MRKPLKLEYIRGEYLRTIWECAREMRPEVARVLEERFKLRPDRIEGDGWYSLEPVKGIWRDFERVCDEEAFTDLIRRATGKTIVGRYIPIFTTPRTAIRLIPRKLNDIFIGTIEVSVSLENPGRVAYLSIPYHNMGHYFCCAIRGGLLGIMDAIGVKAEVDEVECVYRGSSYCVFRVTW